MGTLITDREPNWAWSARMWTWGAGTDASHFLTLQDDARVAPLFWPALEGMLAAVPDQVINLEVVHPATPALARAGHRWYTTSDLLVGVGYVLPTTLLREFLAWRAALKPGAVEAISEDTLIATWCVATGRRIWNPVPTIIDHDTSLPSTYGNDGHAARRPPVRWDTHGSPALGGSTPRTDAPHLGRHWDTIGALARRWVPGFTAEQERAYLRDDGRQVKRRLAAVERARQSLSDPIARLLLCTPTKGGLHPEYCQSVLQLATLVDLDVESTLELSATRFSEEGIVVARANMIRHFLGTDCTHLLFVDADVSFDPHAVYGMLASGHDFVQTPYPKRGTLDWKAVARTDDERPLEARGHRYTIRTLGPWRIDDHHCAEIMGTGLGLTLISRACLEKMADHYRSTLEAFTSVTEREPTVLLTALLLARQAVAGQDARLEYLSEDLSLCERWRQMGGRVMLYLGPGSPATHHGDYAFRGQLESLGLRREPAEST